MKKIFADTGYWIALFYTRDEWHTLAQSLETSVLSNQGIIYTTDFVLTEFLNFFTKFNPKVRQKVSTFVLQIEQHPNIKLLYSNPDLFNRAAKLYCDRMGKQWSLTDCHSFLIMEDLKMREALAHDRHFEQAGFQILLKK